MAEELNIGDLNIGLEFDVRALKSVQKSLRDFARRVDSVITRLDRLTRQENAFIRQERAIRRAREAVLDLSAAIKRAGGDSRLIANNTRAFQALQRAMRAGKLDALDFARAQDRFRAALNTSKRALAEFKAKQREAADSKLNRFMRDLTSASVLMVGPLSGLGARIAALGSISSRSSLRVAALFGAISAGVVAVGRLSTAMVQARRDMDRTMAVLQAAFGEQQLANREFRFAINLANKLGINIRSISKNYAQYAVAARSAGLTTQEIRDTFEGLLIAGTALRLNNEELAGLFKAMRDIMSKGVVQAEELRGQMGDRIPGAFSKAARAIGVTEEALNQMLKRGEVSAALFAREFPRVLREDFSGAAVKASNTLDAELNRLSNAFFDLSYRLDQTTGVSAAFTQVVRLAAATLNALNANLPQVISGVAALTAGMAAFAAPPIFRGLVAAAKALKAFAVSAIAAAVASGKLSKGNIVKLLGRVAAAAVVAAGAWKLVSGAVQEVVDGLEDLAESISKRIEVRVPESVAEAIKAARDELQLLQLGFKGITPELEQFILSNKLLGTEFAKIKQGALFLRDELVELDDLFRRLSREKALQKALQDSRTASERLQDSLRTIQDLRAYAEQALQGEELARTLERLDRLQSKLEADFIRTQTLAGEFGTTIASSFEDAIVRAREFEDVLESLRVALERIIVRRAVTRPFEEFIGQTLARAFPNAFGQGTAPQTPQTPQITLAAKGAVVTGAAAFPTVKGLGVMGESGPEAILPLARTAGGRLGVAATGFAPEIVIIDQRGASAPPIDVQQSVLGGRLQIRMLIKSELQAVVESGHLDATFKRRFGMVRRPV